ncbi:MAG: glucose-6-phosphate dehydrogenase [Chloroflexi bacterium]|nr:glucose-6-phosphate dehydrogenase [Chloroflexota bacterium]BCY18596.1 glucose-6-phosphate 1-dehydrogenase [Leptolinea sp. HRD-7]
MFKETQSDQSGDSTAFVIFGVTGDLTRRKLMPAIYELAATNRLPVNFQLVGFARRDWTDEILVQNMTEGVEKFSRRQPVDTEVIKNTLSSATYIMSDFNDPEGYNRLARLFDTRKICNVMYYLATPPDNYEEIIRHIGSSSLKDHYCGWTRIVIEKPYGRDIHSATELDGVVHSVFKENQVFRIDHYLGKETVQNILVFRFANGIFEPLWNNHYVDHVQITVSETNGVGTRAGYYETSGVIRDIFQNHLLQLLSLTAMEAPVAFNDKSVRDEKVKILRSLRPWKASDALANTYRAQYASGMIDGQRVPGYKDEPGVAPASITETYMAARLFVDNWRWAGVPFYVRSGKRMPAFLTEIAIQFKQVPLPLFNWQNMAGDAPNVLVLNLQPNEGITLTFGAKLPGQINQIAPAKMEFNYQQAFGGNPPEAYVRLLQDAMSGDATLFTRSDEVHAAWEFTSSILDAWKGSQVKNLPVYEAGTWGPPGADDFIGAGGRHWREPA